jgi:hypothetical protein
MAANVKIIKLLNGIDLIGDVNPQITDSVTVTNPIRVVVMPNKLDPKTPNVGFAPFAEFSDEKTFSFDKSHVLCIMTPIQEFVNQYNSMFGGIIQPASKLIVPGA